MCLFFSQNILSDIREERPVVVIFPDVNFRALQIVITYMYQGQVSIISYENCIVIVRI